MARQQQLEVIFGTSAVYSFRSTDVGVCDGEPVEFSGSGEPIQGGDLVPTDGAGFQAVINKFRYPLSREEITDLINDTTKGLAFTRSTDPTTLQTNNISRINIPSIHKGMAELELKYSCNDGASLDRTGVSDMIREMFLYYYGEHSHDMYVMR